MLFNTDFFCNKDVIIDNSGRTIDQELTVVFNSSSLISKSTQCPSSISATQSNLGNEVNEDLYLEFIKYLHERDKISLITFFNQHLQDPLFLDHFFHTNHFIQLELDSESMECLLNILFSLKFSFVQSIAIFGMIFNWLVVLSTHPSRSLLNTIINIGKESSHAIIDGLLIKLVIGKQKDQTLFLPQIEYYYHYPQHDVLKEVLSNSFPEEMQLIFILKLVKLTFSWSEFTISLFQFVLLDLKLRITNEIMEGLISLFEYNVNTFKENTKFCTLIFNIICSYQNLVIQYKQRILQLLDKTDTFMSKKAKSKLLGY